jgi:hypothetical protein
MSATASAFAESGHGCPFPKNQHYLILFDRLGGGQTNFDRWGYDRYARDLAVKIVVRGRRVLTAAKVWAMCQRAIAL